MNTSTPSTGLRGLIGAALLGALASSFSVVSTADPHPVQDSQNSGTPEARAPLVSTVSPWVKRAQRLGPAEASKRILITAFLSWRNPEELQQLLKDQTDPNSASYGQFLTPEQFHEQFSPSAHDVTLVQRTLRDLGFNVEYTPDSGLFVRASGTVAQVKQAFHVRQNLYAWRGKTLRAHDEEPSVPAALKGVVTYIGGLDDSRMLMRPLHVSGLQAAPQATSSSRSTTPQQVQPPHGSDTVQFPCSNYWGDTRAILEGPTPFPYGTDLPWLPCHYTPQQVREAYGVNHTDRTGRGVRVAITLLYASPTVVADVNRYSANHGLPALTQENFQQLLAANVNSIPAGDPCGLTDWFSEETLDVTAVHAIAPDADILYVGGACDEVDMADGGVALEPLYEVIDHRLADIVSDTSIYNGEADVSAGQMLSNNLEFIQAALEGISIVNASGDDGDLTMKGTAFGGPNPIASGSWPATSPFVTAVGGTLLLLLNASGEKQEYPWATWFSFAFQNPLISPDGTLVSVQGYPASFTWQAGSGGGPSLAMPEPWYQFGVVPDFLATQTVSSTAQIVTLRPPKRVTPDVAMVAVGFLVGETYLISVPPVDAGCTATSATTEYCEEITSGTSLATPLFAGVLALVNEARFAHGQGSVGFVNPALYRLPVGRHWYDDTPILDIDGPSTPIGGLIGFQGVNNFLGFIALDSTLGTSGNVIENADSSLLGRPGYDSATGLGAPNVPALIRALSGGP